MHTGRPAVGDWQRKLTIYGIYIYMCVQGCLIKLYLLTTAPSFFSSRQEHRKMKRWSPIKKNGRLLLFCYCCLGRWSTSHTWLGSYFFVGHPSSFPVLPCFLRFLLFCHCSGILRQYNHRRSPSNFLVGATPLRTIGEGVATSPTGLPMSQSRMRRPAGE